MYAQPVLHSDSLHTGQTFNLYLLSGVNIANLTAVGPNASWDISAATATLAGTAEFQDMASTPYAAQYPAANFAMKFTMGANTQYSLFKLSPARLEEVANNVGAAAVDFIDYRTAIFFPYTYNATDTDTYQKTAQPVKTITNTYSGYGDLITNPNTFANTVKSMMNDDGNTNVSWWNSSPLVPLLQVTNGNFTLWKQTGAPTGLIDYSANTAFDLYPNPSTNNLHIINKRLITQMDIYNAAGQFLFSAKSSVIDISMLKSGIYYLKAITKDGDVQAQKFIKQ